MEQYSRDWWKAQLPNIQAFVDGKEIQINQNGWKTGGSQVGFGCDPKNYRIKPATRTINGFEVPAPVRDGLSMANATYCVPVINEEELYGVYDWDDDGIDERYLTRGLVFLTKEAAIANAKAMLGIDPKEGV